MNSPASLINAPGAIGENMHRKLSPTLAVIAAAFYALSPLSVKAIELNWSGQFRAETHWLYNYTLDRGNTGIDPARMADLDNAVDTDGDGDATNDADIPTGYYVPGGGESNAFFQNVFMRLRPSLVVNDNIYIKSEWWVGDPVFGFFGDGVPYTADRRQYYSTFNRGSSISAQRFWAEFLTDLGTLQVGRAPLHWGLGVLWNSGNDLWDRYPSTGDTVRLVSKFGWFSFVPSVVKYSMGRNIGGGCVDAACTSAAGNQSIVDYSLMLKYENPDQDFDFGINFVRRIAGIGQDRFFGFAGNSGASLNYNTYDFYTRKRLGSLSLGLEVPLVTGRLGDADYSTWAAAGEVDWEATSRLQFGLRFGHAPGQSNSATATPDKFQAYFFHPSYRLGMIMFNYALHNFHGPNTLNDSATSAATLASPFDNPIVNANYLSVNGGYTLGRWQLRTQFTFATALETAETGLFYYNTWNRRIEEAVADQGSSLGWEMDYGVSFHWDEAFQFHLDFGWFFPGEFYRFANNATVENSVAPVFGTTFRAGVNF